MHNIHTYPGVHVLVDGHSGFTTAKAKTLAK